MKIRIINWFQFQAFLLIKTLEDGWLDMLLIYDTGLMKVLCFYIHYEWVTIFYFCFFGTQVPIDFFRMSTA